MIRIVQRAEEILVERMDICQSGKSGQDGREFLRERLGGIFDFADVEGADARDCEARADLGG